MVLLILRQRLLSLRNTLTPSATAKRLPFAAAGIGFWVLFYIGSLRALGFLRQVDVFGEVLAERLLAMVFFSLSGFLVLSNVITALSAYYLSRDIPFLLAKPVAVRDMLRLKLIETVLNSSWMVLAFSSPVFVAYGVGYGAPAYYYPVVLCALLLLLAMMSGAGIAIAHLLTRIFPAHRSREILLAAGLVLLLATYFVVKTIVPRGEAQPEDIIASFVQFRADSPLLPAFWAFRMVLPTLTHAAPDALYSAVLVSNCLFFLLLAAGIGKRLYLENLDRMQPAGGRGGSRWMRSLPSRTGALFYKDVRLFLRDAGQWSQVFIIAALVMVYVYNFRAVPLKTLAGVPFLKEIMVLVNMTMAGLVLSAVCARFLFTAVSLEGQAFWVVQTAPVDLSRVLRSKLLHGTVPVTALITTLVAATNAAMGTEWPIMSLSLATVTMLCISVCGLAAGLGAIYPKFKYENIASVPMGMGGLAFMLLSFVLIVATLTLESWGYYAVATGRGSSTAEAAMKAAVAASLIVCLNVVAWRIPMKLGEKAMREMEP